MESFEDGAYYPTSMNCLSNLHKSKGKVSALLNSCHLLYIGHHQSNMDQSTIKTKNLQFSHFSRPFVTNLNKITCVIAQMRKAKRKVTSTNKTIKQMHKHTNRKDGNMNTYT